MSQHPKLGLVLAATLVAFFGRSADAADPLKETTNSQGIVLVRIPAGEFLMGSGESGESIVKALPEYTESTRPDYFADEFPQHRVRITRPFYFGKYEVTNAQFRAFVDATGYKTEAEEPDAEHPRGWGGWRFNSVEQKFEGLNPDYTWRTPGFPLLDEAPVVNVTYNDAVAFCDWLSKTEGKKYRLPSEAEWEYSARAGAKTRYVGGDDPDSLAKIGNTADADFYAAYPKYYPREKTLKAHDGFALPAPVGKFPPNAFGLHDVQGNVWEWTSDWYDETYYARSPVDDPRGPETGKVKVRRGGAWHTAPLWSRVSFRNYNTLDSRYPNLGFRLVLEE